MSSSTKRMRHIRLLALGSQGDVVPYVSLGLGLQQAGFDVSIGTTADFRPLVESYGLPCVTTNWGLRTIVRREAQAGGHSEVSADKRLSRQQQWAQREFLRLLWQTTLELAEGADMLLYSFAALFAAPHVAEKLGIPAIVATYQPAMTPTRAFPLNRAPALPLGGWYNRFTYACFEQFTWLFLHEALNTWRRETLHLAPLDRRGLFAPLHRRNQPMLFGFSPAVLPKPADWGDHLHLTGYWFPSQQTSFQPSAELTAFLQAGAPPISIGFGSMISPDPKAMLDLLLAAVKQAGVRAVLIAHGEGISAAHLPEQVFLLDQVPHDWLFPQMAATVHHGGAGTTGASLRAGIPTVVVPFLSGMDQAFWGKRVAALGVGPTPIPFTRLTTASLALAIQQAVSDETMRKKAAQIGQRIRAEDGIGNAVQVIEQFVSNY
jgi:sterol 3beta-glucosyltransferase